MNNLELLATLLATASTSILAIPASGTLRAGRVFKVRWDVEAIGLNGNMEWALGIRTSDDGANWTNHTTMGDPIIDFTTATGWIHATTGFRDLSAFTDIVQYVQFVWYTKLSGVGSLASVYVHGSLDIIPKNG